MKVPKRDLTLYGKDSPLNTQQLLCVLQETPKEHIYTRPAKGGGQWDYVTGTYVKKTLNYVFGWLWDFEVKKAWSESNQVITQGRLTIKNKEGIVIIVKEQFGRADIKYKRGTETPIDLGNDYKASATDALKKCASELGIASDVYGKNEFKQIQTEEIEDLPVPAHIQEKKAKQFEEEQKVHTGEVVADEKIQEVKTSKFDDEILRKAQADLKFKQEEIAKKKLKIELLTLTEQVYTPAQVEELKTRIDTIPLDAMKKIIEDLKNKIEILKEEGKL